MNTIVRLNLLVTFVFAVVLIACLAILIRQAKTDIEREVSANIAMVSALLEDVALPSEKNAAPVEKALPTLAHPRHLRVILVSESGVIRYDSHASEHETTETPAWFRNLVWDGGKESLQKRLSVRGTDVLLLGYPWDELDEVWEGALRLLLLLLGCALLSNLAVFWGGRLSLRPINHFLHALDEIQKGHFQARLQTYSLPEARRLAVHFNCMASALEQQQETNRALTQQLISLQEQERGQLARELHDDLGQHLSAIKALAYIIRHASDASTTTAEHADKIIDNSDSMLKSFRSIIRRLRPVILDQLDIYLASRQLCIEWSQTVGIECQFTLGQNLPALTAEQSIQVYRILQEALNNVTKHACTKQVDVNFDTATMPEGQQWSLVISDKGIGYNKQTASEGLGLLFMQERAQAMGGYLDIESTPGEGVTIRLSFLSVSKSGVN